MMVNFLMESLLPIVHQSFLVFRLWFYVEQMKELKRLMAVVVFITNMKHAQLALKQLKRKMEYPEDRSVVSETVQAALLKKQVAGR